jgi:hypothetical protein
MMAKFKMNLNSKFALVIILFIISIMIIDSSIVKFIAYGNKELPTRVNVGIFIAFSIFFIGIVTVLLRSTISKDPESKIGGGIVVRYSHLIISFAQSTVCGILIIIILQIVFLKNYSILSLIAGTYISHIMAIFFLISLVLILLEWLRASKNKILSLYAISFSLSALAIIISLIYTTNVLSYQPSTIKPSPIHFFLLNLPHSELSNSFGTTLDIISILSFVSVWIASGILLSTYSRRLGKIRYWAIITIPLIYFLFPFEIYFVNIFQSLLVSSPELYGLINVLVLSAPKQIGALFFSLAFIAASSMVANQLVQKYLLISAIGMATLFGSIEIDTLLYAVYPPFGLVTISFMPIGAYLLFNGIFASATFVARDKALRKEFHKTAMSQLSLLKTIGVSQMESELLKSYKSIEKQIGSLKTEPRFEKDNVREMLHDVLDELPKENVREILHDVLTELYIKTKNKTEDSGES